MKTWIWIAIGGAVLILIMFLIWRSSQLALEKERTAQAQLALQSTVNSQGGNPVSFLDIINNLEKIILRG